ncbi:hypothetical protein [Halomontanus rarus]|uniref:hypothetical protein n=1 Tax=Halomontanus rarus TaxID=3034020 RepID=UPI0023E8EDC8|nr:hypothetical protein [Halovivax sp. TS33]
MSIQQYQSDESTDRPSLDRAAYARYDHWGDSDEDEPECTGHDTDKRPALEQKIKSAAHKFQKATSTDGMIDPIALSEEPENGLHDYKGQVIGLSAPEHVIPKRYEGQFGSFDYSAHSHRWRESEVGHLTFGGTIPDREKERLLADLELFIELASVRIPPSTKETILERARQMKEADYHDDRIFEMVSRCLFDPNEIEDN